VAKACPQSTTSDWPPEGVSPIEAIVRIVGAEWWQAYIAARDTGIRPAVAGGRNRSSDECARLERRAAAYEAAFGPVLDAWEHGELELWAWRGDPTVPPELIQSHRPIVHALATRSRKLSDRRRGVPQCTVSAVMASEACSGLNEDDQSPIEGKLAPRRGCAPRGCWGCATWHH
jgi:hypothetical protein